MGHSTVLLDPDGVRLFLTPCYMAASLTSDAEPPPSMPQGIAGVDAVLVSHLHFDHLDLPSLRQLGRETPLIVPRGGGHLLERHGFRHVDELEAGGEIRVGALTVRATRAEHAGARLLSAWSRRL